MSSLPIDLLYRLADLLKISGDTIIASGGKLTLTTYLHVILNEQIDQLCNNISDESLINSSAINGDNDFTRTIQLLKKFCRKVTKLKLVHSTVAISGSISFHNFKHLTSLELHKVPLHLLSDIPHLHWNLKELICHSCIRENIAELLGHSVWKQLSHLVISHNLIEKLDDSFRMAPNLASLDLRYNCIRESPRNLESLDNLISLDLSYNQISKIPLLSPLVWDSICTLVLQNNTLDTLKHLEVLLGLVELDVRNNCLVNHGCLSSLRSLKQLCVLNLDGNPLSFHRRHRSLTCSMLSRSVCSKILLDGREFSSSEKKLITITGYDDESATRRHDGSISEQYSCEESERIGTPVQAYKKTKKRKPRGSTIADPLGLESSFTSNDVDFDATTDSNDLEIVVADVHRTSTPVADDYYLCDDDEECSDTLSPKATFTFDFKWESKPFIVGLQAPDGTTSQRLITITDRFLNESTIGSILQQIDLQLLKHIRLDKNAPNPVGMSGPVLVLSFEYVQQDLQERAYIVEDSDAADELFAFLQPVLDQNLINKSGTKMQCMSCNAMFPRSAAITMKDGSQLCPEPSCASHLVFCVDQTHQSLIQHKRTLDLEQRHSLPSDNLMGTLAGDFRPSEVDDVVRRDLTNVHHALKLFLLMHFFEQNEEYRCHIDCPVIKYGTDVEFPGFLVVSTQRIFLFKGIVSDATSDCSESLKKLDIQKHSQLAYIDIGYCHQHFRLEFIQKGACYTFLVRDESRCVTFLSILKETLSNEPQTDDRFSDWLEKIHEEVLDDIDALEACEVRYFSLLFCQHSGFQPAAVVITKDIIALAAENFNWPLPHSKQGVILNDLKQFHNLDLHRTADISDVTLDGELDEPCCTVCFRETKEKELPSWVLKLSSMSAARAFRNALKFLN